MNLHTIIDFIKSHKKNSEYLLVFILIIIILIIISIFLIKFLAQSDNIRLFILSKGVFAPIYYILITIFFILIAFMPLTPIIMTGGFIFGTKYAMLYTFIAIIIGATLNFYIGRKYGRRLIEKIVNKKTMKKFDETLTDRFAVTLFILNIMPSIPNDAFSYLAGLTKIKYHNFLIAITLGRIFSVFSLIYIGFQFNNMSLLLTIIIIILVSIFSIIIFIHRKKIEDITYDTIKKIKK